MNELLKIERARVVMVGEFATGTGNNGPWASLPVKVEWTFLDKKEGVTVESKMSAVVVFTGNGAAWARDNVKAGNAYAGVPDMYLNLWLSVWGDMERMQKKDGGYWYKPSNRVRVEHANIADGTKTEVAAVQTAPMTAREQTAPMTAQQQVPQPDDRLPF